MTKSSPINKRHSRLGIASTLAAIAIPALWVSLFTLGVSFGSQKIKIGDYFGFSGVVFAVFAPILHLVASILGISGLFSRKTKKLFPVIGAVLNAMLGICGILIIWLFVTNMSWGFR